jgi:hypothetical protein
MPDVFEHFPVFAAPRNDLLFSQPETLLPSQAGVRALPNIALIHVGLGGIGGNLTPENRNDAAADAFLLDPNAFQVARRSIA